MDSNQNDDQVIIVDVVGESEPEGQETTLKQVEAHTDSKSKNNKLVNKNQNTLQTEKVVAQDKAPQLDKLLPEFNELLEDLPQMLSPLPDNAKCDIPVVKKKSENRKRDEKKEPNEKAEQKRQSLSRRYSIEKPRSSGSSAAQGQSSDKPRSTGASVAQGRSRQKRTEREKERRGERQEERRQRKLLVLTKVSSNITSSFLGQCFSY